MNSRPISPPSGCALIAVFALSVAIITAGSTEAFGLEEEQIDQLRAAVDAFDDEPDIDEVQRHVLDQRDFDDDRPDRWTRRARLSNLLPQFQGQISWLDQRDRQDRFREDIDADDDGQYERNRAQHLWRDDLRLRAIYSARLDFDLAGLVFSGDEIRIQRELRQRWRMRDDIIDEVTELYFARRRLQLRVELFPDVAPEVMLDQLLEIEALTARINSLTGGWFRRQLQEEYP